LNSGFQHPEINSIDSIEKRDGTDYKTH